MAYNSSKYWGWIMVLCMGVYSFFGVTMIGGYWMKTENCSDTLWQYCTRTNETYNCEEIGLDVPAFLVTSRTVAVLTVLLAIPYYVCVFKLASRDQEVAATSFQERAVSVTPPSILLITGSMMLISSIVYHSKYRDFYAKDGRLKDVEPVLGGGFYTTCVGVGGMWLIFLLIVVQFNTGFKMYMASKMAALSSRVGQQTMRSRQRMNRTNVVSIKSGCKYYVGCVCMKRCRNLCTKNNVTNDNENNNGGLHSNYRADERRDARETVEGSLEIISSNSPCHIFVVDITTRMLPPPAYSTSGRCASMASVGGLNLEGLRYDREMNYEGDEDEAPPSYQDVMREYLDNISGPNHTCCAPSYQDVMRE